MANLRKIRQRALVRASVLLAWVCCSLVLAACGTSISVNVGVTVVPGGGGGALIIQYPAMPSGLERARVTNVVDGDTVDVDLNGRVIRLRLIGINTPETVDPRRPVECFGKEASDRAKTLLADQTVLLESDPSQDDRDQYDRYLRFLWFEDGRMFNLQMIAEGYAYEYTYRLPYKYQREFKAAQGEAERNKRGLWSPQTCSGQK